MTPTTIQATVARAIQVRKQIAVLEEEETSLKAKLIKAAGTNKKDRVATEGGGWSIEYQDSDRNIARVTQPAPATDGKLIKANEAALEKLLPGKFYDFFKEVSVYRAVKGFREQAESLTKAQAKKLFKLATKPSAPQVAFEVAKKEAA